MRKGSTKSGGVNRTPVRCTHRHRPGARACDARRTLTMPPEWYVRLPACRVCGSRSYRVDEHRARVGRGGANNEVCNCGNYFNENGAWPHRKGVGACAHNPTLTEEDFMAIQAQLRARRRG